MTEISQPSVTVSLLSGLQTAGITPQKLLLVGQKTSAGSAIDGELVTNIGNDEAVYNTLGGQNSMITNMIRRARKVNPLTQIDAIFIDDNGAGVSGAGAFIIGGASTESGELQFVVGSKNDFTFIINVGSSDSADTVGTALETAINNNSSCPVTASNSLGDVTLTAVNAGTYGNTLGLATYGSVAGLTNTLTGMSSGAADPSLTSVFDVIGDTRYQGIAWPYADDLTPLTALLDPRFNSNNDILDGVGVASKTDTLANLIIYGNAENDPSLSLNGDKLEISTTYVAPALLEIPVIKATSFAAIRALRLTTGANIGNFVIASNPLDSIGGPALASKPYFNTPFPNMKTVDIDKGWTKVEIEQLKDAAIWVMGNNKAANTVICGEVMTSNKTDNAGNPDVTFSFLNYVDTSSIVREFYFNNLTTRYAQYRLTNGGLIRGRDSANELSIRGFAIQLYQELGRQEYAAVQTGVGTIDGETVDINRSFDENLFVTIDASTGTVIIQMVVFLIVQLRTIIVPITIKFSPNS